MTAPQTAEAATEARLARYPVLANGNIAFLYADDIWLVAETGGLARRLTADGQLKSNLVFSPDGRQLAYAMTAEGNQDTYVLPVAGGVSVRVTHHPAADQPVAWYPDGQNLLIASGMYSHRQNYNQLLKVKATGGLPERLPLAYGETAAFSPDGSKLVYTFYKDFQDGKETWKRYHGGRAPSLWYFDLKTGASRRLTNNDSPNSMPMWVGERIYYLSEQGADERSNIWVHDLNSGEERQITHFTDFDIRHPSLGAGTIAFEYAGKIHRLDLTDETTKEVPIAVATDFASFAPTRVPVADYIEHADIAADGKTVVFAARGDVFTVGLAPDLAINHSQSSGTAERYPSLSPDGTKLAYFSDADGEYQLYIKDTASGSQRKLTSFSDGFRYKPQWSPDGRHLVFIDNAQAIYLVDVANGRLKKIDADRMRVHSSLATFRVSWSPDGRWVAYARTADSGNQAIFIYDVKGDVRRQLTSGYASDVSPVFDPTGNYLYSLSYRSLTPRFGDIDSTWIYGDSMGISVIPLRVGVPSPFDPGKVPFPAAKKGDSEIDFAGAEARLVKLALPAATYTDLAVLPGKIVYRRLDDAARNGSKGVVEEFKLATETVTVLARDVDDLITSAGAEAGLIRRDKTYAVLELAAEGAETNVPVAKLAVELDVRAENRQQFTDGWRYLRDFFYDPNHHGLDWQQVGEKYRPFVEFVVTDSDMTALLRELSGEVSAGHVYASSGLRPTLAPSSEVGLLGADLRIENGAYRIGRILSAGPRSGELRSPLAAPGLDVSEGDYLLAINGVALDPARDPWVALQHESGAVVRLTINKNPSQTGARQVLVRTLSPADELKLRERTWVEANRALVLERSGGRIGYIYVPDTSRNGQDELMSQYRAEFGKDALIIDERFNRGGALGDRLVELLKRPALAYFAGRNMAHNPLPELAHNGPKALLINGWSYSGGDGFPFLFKEAQAGTLIGTRTWGGLIGPQFPLPLISGGLMSAPNSRVYDRAGNWAAGNHGVVPHVEIENDPSVLYAGTDRQLLKAVELLLGEMKNLAPHQDPVYPTQHNGER
ncbi:S41 family peptidase [Govanella unica]|uniref:Tricorn protease homolog n=1 Tax=Govanella unica TaxID=2975056 RepID=A0A9X3Z746_9PROT|nr:S41 family peptidase [Govania unica]MDA5193860.1 PDZ domain-containing protein [Govania unica]